MTLTCTSLYADGTPCQEQDPRHAVHHAHDRDGSHCRRWVDPDDTTTQIPAECDWLPLDQIERRGNEAAAKLKARRERILAAAVDNPDNPVLQAAAERLRRKEGRPKFRSGLPTGRGPLDALLADIAKTNWRVYVYDAGQWQPGSSAYNTPEQAKQRQAELAARWPGMPTAIVRETRSYQAEEG